MKGSRFLLLVAVLVASASVISAADLPVSYLVEEKPLRAAIAGTSLSFELYSDNACTALVQSMPVLVEDVSLLTKLKQLTPKGDTKLPNTVELRNTLTGVMPATAIYARVTGIGVVPVGGACQAQASAVAGPPGATGPTGPAGPGLVVKDSNGSEIGPGGMSDSRLFVFLPVAGPAVRATVDVNALRSDPLLPSFVTELYESVDCSGTSLKEQPAVPWRPAGITNGIAYFPPSTVTTVMIQSSSQRPNSSCPGAQVFIPPDRCCCPLNGCQLIASPYSAGPTQTYDVTGFVPPFHVEVQ